MKFQNISIHDYKLTLCSIKHIKREVTLKWDIIRIRKKNMGHLFFHEESIYEISNNSIYGSKLM